MIKTDALLILLIKLVIATHDYINMEDYRKALKRIEEKC